MRETTERPEAVLAGTVKLVGTNPDRIVGEASKILDSQRLYKEMASKENPYGDGLASQRITDFFLHLV
jgi:UDP-N-acetylglucosamine 2-epimerase